MKTYIERTLVQIREIGERKGYLLSCDIYYNNFGGESKPFVVNVYDAFGLNEHFRTNHIRKSLKMALKWLKNLK